MGPQIIKCWWQEPFSGKQSSRHIEVILDYMDTFCIQTRTCMIGRLFFFHKNIYENVLSKCLINTESSLFFWCINIRLAVEAYWSKQECILMKDYPTSESIHDGDYSGGTIFQKTEMFMIVWKLIFCFAFLRQSPFLYQGWPRT